MRSDAEMGLDAKKLSAFFRQFLLERGIDIEAEKLADFNFVESGLLDSFEILTMIMQLEVEFDVRLTPEALSEKKHASVGGLMSTIQAYSIKARH